MYNKPAAPTPLVIPAFAFGCEPLGGTDWGEVDLAAIESAIHLAVERGALFFDTADVYGLGLSEERLARILGKKRHELIIATKVGVRWTPTPKQQRAQITNDGSEKYLKAAVEASLRRLKLDTLPICYLHKPDPNIPIADSISTLSDLQKEGKIKAIGCSNVNLSQLIEAKTAAHIDIVQIEYNLLERDPEKDLLPYCHENMISVAVYGGLAQGLLTGKYRHHVFPNDDRRSRLKKFSDPQAASLLEEFKSFAENHGHTPAQMAISWLISQPAITTAILGIKTPLQLQENLMAFDKPLSLEIKKKLSALFAQKDI